MRGCTCKTCISFIIIYKNNLIIIIIKFCIIIIMTNDAGNDNNDTTLIKRYFNWLHCHATFSYNYDWCIIIMAGRSQIPVLQSCSLG